MCKGRAVKGRLHCYRQLRMPTLGDCWEEVVPLTTKQKAMTELIHHRVKIVITRQTLEPWDDNRERRWKPICICSIFKLDDAFACYPSHRNASNNIVPLWAWYFRLVGHSAGILGKQWQESKKRRQSPLIIIIEQGSITSVVVRHYFLGTSDDNSWTETSFDVGGHCRASDKINSSGRDTHTSQDNPISSRHLFEKQINKHGLVIQKVINTSDYTSST